MDTSTKLVGERHATLVAAQSNGDLSTLEMTQHNNTYSLSVVSTTREAGGNPSWLNIDLEQRLLYCLDRGQSNDTKGSVNSFRIEEKGLLSKIESVEAPFSGVAAEFLDLQFGKRGNKSAIAAFLFDSRGSLQPPTQVLHPISNTTGPIANRQNDSHCHHVILDPSKKFFLVPDLGADLIRVFRYHTETFAPLAELEPLRAEPGAGPRHGVFWRALGSSHDNDTYLIFNGELSQKVYSYRVTYTSDGLAWEKAFETHALGELGKALSPNTAPTSEIVISPDQRFLLVSSRQHSFELSPLHQKEASDSISTFRINHDASLNLIQVAPSGGYLPRQFSLNKTGDKVAVGHQGSSTVVVWERDLESGIIGRKLAERELRGPVVFTGWVDW
ncbi:hypothetical protein E8E13_008857 [Curvularia kusanoi]|uniref:Isomerase YbhE n=1 Tax=Curvularia kusanoi TaxID=90978 RepID=A0A9P4TFZ3_CURKU|nr:hypothetical protein E8E13_008857 [Curvularia kusanoi]